MKRFSLKTTWDQLKPGIEEIYALQKQNMDRHRLFRLYTVVYNYYMDGNDPLKQMNQNSSNAAQETLYERLKQFLRSFVEKLINQGNQVRNEQLLQFYTKAWDDFKFSSRALNYICSYKNRYWTGNNNGDTDPNDVYEIYTLALLIWRDHWSQFFSTSLTTAVLTLVEKDRCGDTVNSSFISGVVNSYMTLDNEVYQALTLKSKLNIEDSKLKVYKESFETKFLQESEKFYIQMSGEFMQQNSMSHYILKVDQWLQEEKKRAQIYQLHSRTYVSLTTLCENVLIKKHLERFYTVFRTLLSDHKTEELGRLYRLVSHINGVIEELKTMFEEFVLKQGNDAIERCGLDGLTDAKLFVTKLFDVQKKYNSLVVIAFASDIHLNNALDNACAKFVNTNAVTERAKTSTKSPELLAKYCDILLKKGSKNPEVELEEALNQIMVILGYIENKDVFQMFYTALFGRRLLNHTSVSYDSEESVIAKLKHAFGFEYTNKLQRMFQDATISDGLSKEFKEQTLKSSSVHCDFTVLILSSSSWLLQRDPVTISLPEELEMILTHFTVFYMSRHNGKKLSWLHFSSKGEIVTNCLKNKYTLQVSTLQMVVLLQYNSSEKQTLQQLMESTQIDLELLKQVLQPLLKSKVLLTEEPASEECLTAESVIAFNERYNNKKLRINLNVRIKEYTKQDDERTLQNVENNRKFAIDAAIVRVMKTRKTLKHQQLVSEVCGQLNNLFKPSITVIKKCITDLIEKEYMERDENSRDTYHYLA